MSRLLLPLALLLTTAAPSMPVPTAVEGSTLQGQDPYDDCEAVAPRIEKCCNSKGECIFLFW